MSGEELENGEIVEMQSKPTTTTTDQIDSIDKINTNPQLTDLTFDLFAPSSSQSSTLNSDVIQQRSGCSKKFTMWTDCILADKQKQKEFYQFNKFAKPKKSLATQAMKHCTERLVVTSPQVKILKPKDRKNSKERYEKKVEEMVSMLAQNLTEVRLDILSEFF